MNCCLDAIGRADIFFAWIECTTCYGTLVELGYAKALGKTIWIASSSKWLGISPESPLWFAMKMADQKIVEEWMTPQAALYMFAAKHRYKNTETL